MITHLSRTSITVRHGRKMVTIYPESYVTRTRNTDYVISSYKIEFWDEPHSRDRIQPDEKDVIFTQLKEDLNEKGFTLEIQE